MNLHAFRKHLAEELEGIPADAERSFESYAVTTAALARRLLEYLAIDDLSVPDGFRDEPPNYPLRTVLDRILHFRVLYQDAITFNVPGMSEASNYRDEVLSAVYDRPRSRFSYTRALRSGLTELCEETLHELGIDENTDDVVARFIEGALLESFYDEEDRIRELRKRPR